MKRPYVSPRELNKYIDYLERGILGSITHMKRCRGTHAKKQYPVSGDFIKGLNIGIDSLQELLNSRNREG